jgi:serine/threonine protein phosphatase 1
MTQRRIVIGDVHGHYAGLMRLLEEIAPGAEDRVYFLGDLIDRGPQSYQTIEFVRRSGYACLLGNHEQMMLWAFPDGELYEPCFRAWVASGGEKTIVSYPNAQIAREHLDWLETLPFYLDLGDVWLVHAGVNPKLSPQEQTTRDACWIRHEFHNHPQPYFADKLIITGHTISFTFPDVPVGHIAAGPGWLDIDTGAYNSKSGWLTGFEIDRQLVYQVNVLSGQVRTLPLSAATSPVNPARIAPRSLNERLRSRYPSAVISQAVLSEKVS